MKYIIITAIVVIASFLGFKVFADGEHIPYRTFRVIDHNVYKFVDPDNGNVCYLSDVAYGYYDISCVKP